MESVHGESLYNSNFVNGNLKSKYGIERVNER